jgi:UDP-N-acetylmuramyl pentapeptide synthase
MKTLIQKRLMKLARKVVQTQKPIVVAVTGSVGKTSTRTAVATVLASKMRVRTAEGNYNNEIGVPLTILGMKSPGRSVIGWMKVFAQGNRLARKKDDAYPEALVLEYGIDRPGDMEKLCEMAPPDVSVLTAVSPVHAEFFGSVEALAAEKGVILKWTKTQGACVLNADDVAVLRMRDHCNAPAVTYGFSESADVRAANETIETREDYSFDIGEQFAETHFDLAVRGNSIPAALINLLGRPAVSASLAATAVGLHFGLSLDEMVAKLAEIPGMPGRLRPLPGIKGSLVLDDSYNAAPASMRASLDVLMQFHPVEGARRIAALGHMAELGPYSDDEHRAIGKFAAESVIDLLVIVGPVAHGIREGALAAGMAEDRIVHVPTSEEAGRYLDPVVKKGDVVLVKGSQSARMEKVTKDLMAEPIMAEKLLVRQTGKWLES